MLDGRLVDIQLHPLMWRSILCAGPFSQRSLRELDPVLCGSMNELRTMDDTALAGLCVDFTLPGHPTIDLKEGGSSISVCRSNVEEYIDRVVEASLVTSVGCQIQAFRTAFTEV